MKRMIQGCLTMACMMGVAHSASAAIYVENLPASTSIADVENTFSRYGKVMKVTFAEKKDGVSTTAGFVHMGNFSMEKNAIQELQGKKINGNKVTLSQAKPRTYKHDVLIP
jgi:RNA recognition motif-containing protein